jgi:hypothetical protein
MISPHGLLKERPAFGTAPIRCGKMKCKWRGYETDLSKMQKNKHGIQMSQNVCPSCGCDSYLFMTEKEIASWQLSLKKSTALPCEATFKPVANGAGYIKCSCGWQSQVEDDGTLFEEGRYSATDAFNTHKLNSKEKS